MFGIILTISTLVFVLSIITTTLKIGFGITGLALKILFSKPVMLGLIVMSALKFNGII